MLNIMRNVVISGLQEGINLDAKIKLQNLFAIVPSRVINALLLSNPETSAQQVIDFSEPEYSGKELVDDKIFGLRLLGRGWRIIRSIVSRETSYLYFVT